MSSKVFMTNIAQNLGIPRRIKLLHLKKATFSLSIYNYNNKFSQKVNHSLNNHLGFGLNFGLLDFSFMEIRHVFMKFILTSP